MDISEAEKQILASICGVESEGSSTDQAAIEARGEGYWIFKENWAGAYEKLIDKGLINYDDECYCLTDTGRSLAKRYRSERPDMFWYYYQKFYPAARASDAHSKLCEIVFGENLCQDGQTDMTSLNRMLELLGLNSGERALDLGCGAGDISEYIFDKTGASVTGIDYAASAIAEATNRTNAKKPRLDFMQGNFNELVLERESYDVVISLDTLYWAADLEKTMSMLVRSLRKGGRMGIFMNHHIGETDSPSLLGAQHSDLSRALASLGLSVETFNYTKEIGDFWHRVFQAATSLRGAFEAEGNDFIAASLLRESEEEYLPDINGGRITRYLYLVRS